METTRVGGPPITQTSEGRVRGAAPRARAFRRRSAGRLAMLVSLVALSAASLVATFRPELLDWSPTVLEAHRDPALALTVLAAAVAVALVLAVVGSLRRRPVLRWLPGLLVPATMAVMFWLAAPPSRLLVLYVATLGLALRAADEAVVED